MAITAEQKSKMIYQFIDALPFSRALEMTLEELGDGVATISMPYSEALIGDPQTKAVSDTHLTLPTKRIG